MPHDKVFVIAEAGVNHNGRLDLALGLVDAAADAGADAVKFQTFRAESLVSRNAPKAEYQRRNSGSDESQFAMLKQLELDEAAHCSIVARCTERRIEFMSTAFDLESLDLLVQRLDVARLKIPSGEVTNAPLLFSAARTGKALIVSTGMSYLGEIEDALGVIAFGCIDARGRPRREAFREAYRSDEGQGHLRERVTLLHCTTEYPTPFEETNLRAMDTLSVAFGLPVGFSDHTCGIAIPIAAAARGAVVVEKHYTLDKQLPGPDHKASLEPDELAAMIRGIRQTEIALGDGRKRPVASEVINIQASRKSLVASREIAAGEPFSIENLAARRPGGGISPIEYFDWLGRPAPRGYAQGEWIKS